jgi:hypothetical protein
LSEQRTFSGTETELIAQLVGDGVRFPGEQAENAGLEVLEFLAARDVRIAAAGDGDEGLELALGGPVFFSVQKFLWDAAAGIVGLAVALVADQSGALTSAVTLVKSMIASVSVFRSDSVEFQVYGAVAALQKQGREAVKVAAVRDWLREREREIAPDDLAAGVAVLVERGLLRKLADGSLRIRL